jgi:hypothetical protein
MKEGNWSSIWGELIVQVLGGEQMKGDRVSREVQVMKAEKVDSIRLIKILIAEIQPRAITAGKEMQWQHHLPEHPPGKVRVMNVNLTEEV